MHKATSVNGVPIKFTTERWEHITMGHPEITDFHIEILHAVESPEIIYAGSRGELLAVRSGRIGNDKKVVVVYRGEY